MQKEPFRLWCVFNQQREQAHRNKNGKRISISNHVFLKLPASCGSRLRHNSGVLSLYELCPFGRSCGQKGRMAMHRQISNSVGSPPERLFQVLHLPFRPTSLHASVPVRAGVGNQSQELCSRTLALERLRRGVVLCEQSD